MATQDELRLPVKEKPTFFNKEAAIGFLLGSHIPIVGTIAGTVIGGLIGKSRMKSEAQEGKVVGAPTIWNKDMALGLLIGDIAALAVGAVTGLLTGSFVMFGVGMLASVIGGAWIGGQHGKHKMEQEYAQAVAIRDAQQPQVMQQRAQEIGIGSPSYTRSVSQEETLALEARMKQGNPALAQFAEQLEQARKQPAAIVPKI